MAAPKRVGKLEREKALAEVATLYRRGYSQSQIAAKLGVSQPQVSYDIRKIKERYAKTQILERGQYLAEKLDQYADVRKEAWEAWQLSRQAVVDDMAEQITAKALKALEEHGVVLPEDFVVEVRAKSPMAEYLTKVMDTLKAERELLGIDAPTKSDNINRNINVDWDQLAGMVGQPVDAVEQKLEQLAGGLPNGLKELPEGNGTCNGTVTH